MSEGQFTTLFTWTRVNSIWSLYSVKVPATATMGSRIPDQVLLTKQVLCDTAIYKTILTNVKIMNLNFLKYAKRWNIWVPGQTLQRLRLIKCCIKILSGQYNICYIALFCSAFWKTRLFPLKVASSHDAATQDLLLETCRCRHSIAGSRDLTWDKNSNLSKCRVAQILPGILTDIKIPPE